ncbi:MAG TPA: EAL domain-containing protein [Candidatus Polarisedimenticolia bacterium]|nr:EAL domain-containing protein [Candidatus Polarisedimenticolia bacterium]
MPLTNPISRPRLRHGVIAALAGAVCLSGALEPVERHWMDLRFRMLKSAVQAPVVVVEIDPHSLERLDVWPWPRGYHATVLEQLERAGAARVAFDLDFSSRSDPDEDDAFAGALRATEGRTILPVFHRWQAGPDGGGRLAGTAPIEAFRDHATLASINIRPESDGLVRRYWPSGQADAARGPSLAAALLEPPRRKGDLQRPFYLDYAIDTASIPRVSYVDVLTGQFDPERVRGRAVIVGATAVELGDRMAVPAHVNLAGPVLQALAFACIHTDRMLQRIPPWGAAAAAMLLGLLFGPRLEQAGWRRGLAMLGLLLAGLLAGATVALWRASLILDVAPAGLALSGSWCWGLLRRIDRQSLGLMLSAARLRGTEARMRHLVQHSSEAIVTVSQDGAIETLNPAGERLFGLRARDARGRRLQEFLPGALDAGAAPGAGTTETEARRADGSTFPAEMTITSFAMDARRFTVVFLRDITTRRAQQRALEHMAGHDPLTGLPNRLTLRRRAESCLEQAREEGGAAAFLVLDLDRFKEVNDTLGHRTGDRLLQEIAGRLIGPLGASDTIARTGGDEFVVVVPGAGREKARGTADRLIETLRVPFELDKLRLQVDTSIGIAIYPDHGEDTEALLQHGDVALYQAKRIGNAVSVYDPQLDLNSVRHLTLKGELRDAIEREHLVLHFQPKISGRTGRVAGVEALVRWRHPQHGLLPPAEFVPMAESTGLIRDLTRWVLGAALRQCALWRRAGHELSVAVNCSARNLLEEDFCSGIAARLEEAGVPGSRLVLELTETAIVEDARRSAEAFGALAALGIRLSIDDFGTGYSSLEQLHRLPARELKIDKSFVLRLDSDTGAAVIVRSTVDLAHNLGLEAVAEGVGSEPIWQRLRRMGCDLGQGFHLGHPMPAARFESWLARRSAGASEEGAEVSARDQSASML